MTHTCEHCRESYDATRRDSRFCSSSCRSMAHARRTRGLPPISALPDLDATSGEVEDALRAYLEERFLLDDPLASAALSLARRLDRDGDSLSGMAAALRALDSVIATLRTPADVAGADPLDVLLFLRAVRRADPVVADTIRTLLTDDIRERMRLVKLTTYPRQRTATTTEETPR